MTAGLGTFILGPYIAAALLLAGGGVAKIVSPLAASRPLEALGLPSGRRAVPAIGVAEIVVGGAALANARVGGLAMAGEYLLLAGFLVTLKARKIDDAGCGCSQEVTRPPSWLHVAMNLLAAAAAVSGSLATHGDVPRVVWRMGLLGLPLVSTAVALAWAAYALVLLFPAAFRAFSAGAGREASAAGAHEVYEIGWQVRA